MNEVTKIEKGSTKGIKVFIDGEYRYMLYPSELKRYHIAEEEVLSEQVIHEIDQLVYQRALERAIAYLTNCEQSASMIQFKLKQRGFCDLIIARVIQKLQDLNYQDDYRYAKSYISYHGDHKSVYELKQYLRGKGVAEDVIHKALSENEVNELDIIDTLLRKKLIRYSNSTVDEKAKNKIYASLIRKGFSYSDITKRWHIIIEEYVS